jgi:predicted HTH domain antitoxin
MSITVTLELPDDVEQALRGRGVDLVHATREALAVQLFRRGVLTHAQLSQVLSLDRFRTDALLKRYGVEEHSLTSEDVQSDLATLDSVLGKASR